MTTPFEPDSQSTDPAVRSADALEYIAARLGEIEGHLADLKTVGGDIGQVAAQLANLGNAIAAAACDLRR
jgi:hypothetical protein